MELRDYQQECVAVCDATTSGSHLIVMATGLGKTVTMAGMKRYGRTLILSHRDELVWQPKKYFQCSFGVEKADLFSAGEDVVSASIQTLCREARLARFRPDTFHTIIIDEAHHAAAPSYKKVLEYFRPARVFGFTATPRGDGVSLADVFEDIVFSRDILWGIKNGWLAPIKAVRVQTSADIASVPLVAGELNEAILDDCLANSDTINTTAAAYIQRCHTQGRQTLLYVSSVKLAVMLVETIRALLPEEERGQVEMVTGKTAPDARHDILDRYHRGDVRAIVNCMVLTEGFDAPATSAIVVMRPTCNDSLYQQIVGRGLRLTDGKEDCLVVDIVPQDSSRRHRICTAISLFGENEAYATREQVKRMSSEYDLLAMASHVRQTALQMQEDIRSIHLIQESFDIFEQEEVASVTEDRERPSLPELEGYHVRFNPSADERYEVQFKARKDAMGRVTISEPDVLSNVSLRVYMGRNVYAANVPLSEAVKVLKAVCTVHHDPDFLWSQEAYDRWSHLSPTERQEDYLGRAKRYKGLTLDGLNKAQASNLIDLDVRLTEMRADLTERGLLFKPARSKKKLAEQEEAALTAYRAYQEEMAQRLADGEREYPAFVKKLFAKADKAGREEAKRLSVLKEVNAGWRLDEPKVIAVKVDSDYQFRAVVPATERQEAFIRDLLAQLASVKVLPSGSLYEAQTNVEASAAISVLKALSQSIPDMLIRRLFAYEDIYFSADDYEDMVKDARSAGVDGHITVWKEK